MIAASKKNMTIYSYTQEQNAYGEVIIAETPTGNAIISITPLSIELIDKSPIYKDCKYAGLTGNKVISENDVLSDENVSYKVMYAFPQGRMNVLYLSENNY